MKSRDSDHAFFGQPRGLSTLFFTEFWERFSYYGMRAILLYYMYTKVSNGGLGFSESTSASIMSIYGSLVYMSSVIGGFVSDRLIGPRRSVFWGGILIIFGHIVLSTPFGAPALFISIALIVLGTGLLKPNVSEMVGGLYSEDDIRRDSGFSIFVMGINFGSLFAPLIVGWIGQTYNYHMGFSIAAVGMFIGLIMYYFDGKKYLTEDSLVAPDPLKPGESRPMVRKILLGILAVIVVLIAMYFVGVLNVDNIILLISIIGVLIPVWYFIMMLMSKKISTVERDRVKAYIPLFIAAVLFWAIEEQGSVVLALFASQQTNLQLGSFTIPASWFQTLNPLFIIIYTPFFAWLWVKMGKHQPSSPKKFDYGLFFAGISFLVMVIPVLMFGTHTKVSPLWLVLSWALVEIGELLISPVGLSVTTKLAPRAFQSQMMSMWFLADSAAQAINAQVVKLYTPGTEVTYFTVVGIVTILFGVILLFMTPRIEKLMDGVN
ncbi:di- tripeptide transporter [Lactobacillus selangorensis]|uniref:Di-/tripeptide transporter n=1 Tax=Lactobacillus selangorensis TaxID=81857 RepID=A0A0R2FF50_9LACO|nr:peptide MFS transporter [Lactobacillus selangorensis]KRN27233.1 di- tripeptide transporter [Lactobacillus selangorensis]KRN29845.1 di- tripeptide transporter [Lactobacillus selangorensis]